MRAQTEAAAAAQLWPGRVQAAACQGGADRGATAAAGARMQPAPVVNEEDPFHSCDVSDDDAGDDDAGDAGDAGDPEFIKSGT